MATARQILANRRNACHSTGPKTPVGKKRTRGNSYRHGFAAVSNGEALAEIKQLALQLAGGSSDPIVLQHARDAAHAEFTLARITRYAVAWIARTYAFGRVETEPMVAREVLEWLERERRLPPRPAETMPPPGPDRMTEAIRRALPELVKLERYRERSLAARNRALRALARSRWTRSIPQNEPNFVQENQ